jgi:hypothetical protein
MGISISLKLLQKWPLIIKSQNHKISCLICLRTLAIPVRHHPYIHPILYIFHHQGLRGLTFISVNVECVLEVKESTKLQGLAKYSEAHTKPTCKGINPRTGDRSCTEVVGEQGVSDERRMYIQIVLDL